MNRYPKGSLVLLGTVILMLAVGACNRVSSETTSGTPVQPQISPSTTIKPLTEAQRDGVLAIGIYQPPDLGDGWVEMPLGSDKSLEVDTITDLGGEANCQKLAQTIFGMDGISKSRSGTFEHPDGRLVQNSITTFENVAMADKLLTVLNRTDPRECLDKAFENSFARQLDKIVTDGSTLSSVRVRRVTVAAMGDNTAAFEITLDVKNKDGKLRTIRFTRVAVEVGPTVIDFSLRANDRSFPNVEEAIRPVTQRVIDCLSGAGTC